MPSSAGLTSFTAVVNGELREVDLQPVDQNGVAYVSLPSLASQIGGGYKEEPDHIQVDLASKSVWVYLNQTRVVAASGEFALAHTVVDQNGTILVALQDVVPLFEKGFQVKLKQEESQTAAPAETPAPPLPAETPPPAPVPTPPPTAPAGPDRAVDRPVQVVVIDAGHGGNDVGLEGSNKTKESAITLAIAKKLQHALDQGGGLKTVLTRDAEKPMSTLERSSAAIAAGGDLLISLHTGASLAKAARGVQVYCWPRQASAPEQTKNCPGAPYAERSRAMGEAVAAATAEKAGLDNRGVCGAPCAVLGRAGMVGLLVEVGMMSSPADEALMPTDAFQEQAAQGIATGIRKYLAAQQGGGAR